MTFIELKNVSKQVKQRQLLNQVAIQISKGTIATLEGINGSGKTLVLEALLGLIKTSGQITVNNHIVDPLNAYPIKAGIMIENPSLIENFTAHHNLEVLRQLEPEVPEQEIDELLAYFKIDRFPKQKVKNFSLGMRQKLGIAQAFLGKHPLIVLDEPTNALDETSIDDLVQLIQSVNRKGTTFIIASHDQSFVKRVSNKRFSVKEGVVHEC